MISPWTFQINLSNLLSSSLYLSSGKVPHRQYMDFQKAFSSPQNERPVMFEFSDSQGCLLSSRDDSVHPFKASITYRSREGSCMAYCPGGGVAAYPWVTCLILTLPFAALRLSSSTPTEPASSWAWFCVYAQANLLFASLPFASSPILPEALRHRNGCKESLLTLETIGISQSWSCSAQRSCYQ